jgi:hypothetical protein
LNLSGNLGGEQVEVLGEQNESGMWILQAGQHKQGGHFIELIVASGFLAAVFWICILRCSNCQFKGI